jgi:DNA-binding NarL/FixJ family response regulator
MKARVFGEACTGPFKNAGWDVCGEAKNGREAIAKAQQFQPEVVVLDLAMPHMDGLAAGKVLRQVVPEAHLILFTLHGNLVPADELELSNISAVVSKEAPANAPLQTAEKLVS